MSANARYKAFVIVGLILVVVGSLIALASGRYGLTTTEIVRVLLTGTEDVSKTAQAVLFNVRIPRVVLALVAGAGLAAAGAAFQSVFSNPLATPDTLGVASGAAFGAVLAILLGFDAFWIQAASFVMGLIAVVLVYSVSRIRGQNTVLMLILSGLVIAALFSALISLVKYVADPQDVLPAITFWMMGSLTGANKELLTVGVPFIVVGCLVIYALRWKFNALSLPDAEAKSLGIPVVRLRVLAILSATLISASVVSMCGLIGWVGLLIPHFVRLVVGNNNLRVIPSGLIYGALFMLVCDTVARSATQMEIPVSILTALIGAPVFLLLLRSNFSIRR